MKLTLKRRREHEHQLFPFEIKLEAKTTRKLDEILQDQLIYDKKEFNGYGARFSNLKYARKRFNTIKENIQQLSK